MGTTHRTSNAGAVFVAGFARQLVTRYDSAVACRSSISPFEVVVERGMNRLARLGTAPCELRTCVAAKVCERAGDRAGLEDGAGDGTVRTRRQRLHGESSWLHAGVIERLPYDLVAPATVRGLPTRRRAEAAMSAGRGLRHTVAAVESFTERVHASILRPASPVSSRSSSRNVT